MTPDASSFYRSEEDTLAELAFIGGSEAERHALLATDVFPGSSGKQVVPVELLTGATIDGVFETYRPACVRLWHPSYGILELPFALLSPDLQQCFKHEPIVEGKTALFAAIARIQESAAMAAEVIEDQEAAIASCDAVLDDIEANVRLVAAENDRLQAENAELRAELAQMKAILELEP